MAETKDTQPETKNDPDPAPVPAFEVKRAHNWGYDLQPLEGISLTYG